MVHFASQNPHRATDTAGSRLSNGRAGEAVNNPSPGADAFTFRAPRFGDLVVCPYCDAEGTPCEFCGDERVMFASEIINGEMQ